MNFSHDRSKQNDSSDERVVRKPAEKRDDGLLDSLGKAITAPIAGAAEDDLLPDEDLPPQGRPSSSIPGLKRP